MELIRNHPTFVVLGDSAAFGTGDEIQEGKFRGWAGFLSEAFHDGCDYVNLSRPGAKSSEVVAVQLPQALALKPDICAVIVGGNDLLRNGFDPIELYKNLKNTCQNLLNIGSEIIMVELHDPNQLMRLPKLFQRVLSRRVNAVNAVYQRVAAEFEVITIKTRSIASVHDKSNWHIDRMHPGPKGHFLLARQVAHQLRQRGWAVAMPYQLTLVQKSKAEKIRWLLRNGTPWFFKRSVDLLPAAIILMLFEIIKITTEVINPQKKNGELKFLAKLDAHNLKFEKAS